MGRFLIGAALLLLGWLLLVVGLKGTWAQTWAAIQGSATGNPSPSRTGARP